MTEPTVDPVDSPQPVTQPPANSANLLPSIVRTIVPLIVGLVISGLIKAGLDWRDDAALTDLITAIVTAAYYAAVRFLETHLSTQWGWFLGLAKRPVYEKN